MNPLPGDLSEEETLGRIVRVDHAGEYGAIRIYEGQLAILKDAHARETIAHMMEQERLHLTAFEDELHKRRVRPTFFMPLWHVAGFALGAATALMGPKAAMACTQAVESVIDEHYANQKNILPENEKNLADMIEKFREDERQHHDTAIEEGAEAAPFHMLLSGGIKTATRVAIWLSSRL